MADQLLLWVAFNAFVLAMLALDLFVFHRKAHEVRPLEALIHAMIGVRDLPPSQREAWRAMFEALVFGAGEMPGAHLPHASRGVQGRLSPGAMAEVRAILARTLTS